MKRLLPAASLALVAAASCTLDLAGLPGGGPGGGSSGAPTSSGSRGGGCVTASSGDGTTSNGGAATTATTVTAAATTAVSSVASSGSGGGPTWTRRRKLDLDAGQGNSTFNDFPLLVVLDDGRIDYGQTQDGGQDLRFTDTQGALLDHEIERWNESDKSYVWVRIPSLKKADATGTSIWMYYGNDAASDAQNPEGVWKGGFEGVWHLGENTTQLADSSGVTGQPAQNHGSSLWSDGAIGNGRAFNAGNHEYIDTMNTTDLAKFTVELWVRSQNVPSSTSGPNGPLMRQNNYQICWDHQNPFIGAASFNQKGPQQNWVTASMNPLGANTWIYLAATYDGSKLRAYKNGTKSDETGAKGPASEPSSAKIGRHATDGSNANFFDGFVDEVRISHTPQPDGWIGAQYLSMTDKVISFGDEDTSSTWPLP